MICFLDTEFTDLRAPELLSIGLVSLDGREHYVELDLDCDEGQRRRAKSSVFVHEVVLDFWGAVPGAACNLQEMGLRTGDWLLQLASRTGQRVEIAFDYDVDYILLEQALRDAGLWDSVCEVDYQRKTTRVLSNPRGYPVRTGVFENPDFDPRLIVDVRTDAGQKTDDGSSLSALRGAFKAGPDVQVPAPVEKLSFPRREPKAPSGHDGEAKPRHQGESE